VKVFEPIHKEHLFVLVGFRTISHMALSMSPGMKVEGDPELKKRENEAERGDG